MPRKYDQEFKLNAVKLVVEQGVKTTRVSEDLGIGLSTLERWIFEYKQQDLKPTLKPENEKLQRLEREMEVLRRERDILKKALAIFSSQ
jgi:transposase